jgi:hypothetical protein
MRNGGRSAVAMAVVLVLGACGGGGAGGGGTTSSGGAPGSGVPRSVTIAWDANRETGVNSPGGGYLVAISGRPTLTVAYALGAAAPTSTTVVLDPGTYAVTVRAYAALDPQGGNSGSQSAASQSLTVNVP